MFLPTIDLFYLNILVDMNFSSFVTLFLKKQELYDKLEKWRENHNREMMEIVERCREVEQASREAFNAMIDEKRQKGKKFSITLRINLG